MMKYKLSISNRGKFVKTYRSRVVGFGVAPRPHRPFHRNKFISIRVHRVPRTYNFVPQFLRLSPLQLELFLFFGQIEDPPGAFANYQLHKGLTCKSVILIVDRVLIEHIRFDIALELLSNDRHELNGPVLHEELHQLQCLVILLCGYASTFPSVLTAVSA